MWLGPLSMKKSKNAKTEIPRTRQRISYSDCCWPLPARRVQSLTGISPLKVSNDDTNHNMGSSFESGVPDLFRCYGGFRWRNRLRGSDEGKGSMTAEYIFDRAEERERITSS